MYSAVKPVIKIFSVLLMGASTSTFSSSSTQYLMEWGVRESASLYDDQCVYSRKQVFNDDLRFSAEKNGDEPVAGKPRYHLVEGFRRNGQYVYAEITKLDKQAYAGFIYSEGSATPYIYGMKVGGGRLLAYDADGAHYDLLETKLQNGAQRCVY